MKNAALKNRHGISLLIVVLIISTMALLLATTAGLMGIDALQTGMRQDAALKAFAGNDSCMEIAYKQLRDNHNYTGETVTLDDTVCTITITGSGTTRTVKARAIYASSTYVREIQTNVDWNTKYQVMSWQELTN